MASQNVNVDYGQPKKDDFNDRADDGDERDDDDDDGNGNEAEDDDDADFGSEMQYVETDSE